MIKNGVDRLYLPQQDLFKKAIDIKPHKISLFEAPTGFGKSVVVNTIAEYIALQKKKVIIATPTNHLAIELLDIFKNDKRFSFDASLNVDIVVGKNNYFDIDNFQKEVYEYIDKNEVIEYVSNISTNEDYLIETLFNSITIEEPNKKIVKEIIACKETKEFMKEFSDVDIAITNYAYLLINVFHVKEFDIGEYVVIGDEVHTLIETAENILTNSFSVFRYKNISKQLEKLLKEERLGNKTLFSMLGAHAESLDSVLKKYSFANRAGDFYVQNYNAEKGITAELRASLNKNIGSGKNIKNLQNSLHKSLQKTIEKSSSEKLKMLYIIYSNERNEMLATLNSKQDLTIYLSPSKGFPTINSAKGDVRGWMMSYFWDKVESFIGLSATIKSSKEDKTAFANLGINRNSFEQWEARADELLAYTNSFNRFPTEDDAEYLKLYQFFTNQRKGYAEGWLTSKKRQQLVEKFGIAFFQGLVEKSFDGTEENDKVEHIKYGVIEYKPVFKKEQARVFLPSSDLIPPQPLEGEKEEEWFSMIAHTIYKNYDNKNSMILCGSFYEVENITRILQGLLPDANIISAQKNIPSIQAITRFKKEGGILVGTRNFGTGVNLPKKELEKLFITKIPFPIFTTKKWMDIKESDRRLNTSFYNYAYLSAMLITFRQWIGRLIRTKEDRGDLYLLDSRYYNNRYKTKIHHWLNRMGIVQKDTIEYSHKESLGTSNASQKLLDLISTIECSKEAREYLLNEKNLVETVKYKMFPIPIEDKYSSDFKKEIREIRKKYRDLLKEI